MCLILKLISLIFSFDLDPELLFAIAEQNPLLTFFFVANNYKSMPPAKGVHKRFAKLRTFGFRLSTEITVTITVS